LRTPDEPLVPPAFLRLRTRAISRFRTIALGPINGNSNTPGRDSEGPTDSGLHPPPIPPMIEQILHCSDVGFAAIVDVVGRDELERRIAAVPVAVAMIETWQGCPSLFGLRVIDGHSSAHPKDLP
jgi:hypothetical protein